MFHKTSTKLAGLYLAIMMVIGLFFSFNVYQISTQEFRRGFPGRDIILQRLPMGQFDPETRDRFIAEQESRLMQAKERVIGRLVMTNLLILIGGGILCYFLARRTLKPIEESHNALERFTADASHELRTPITAMQSEIEVALMDPKLTLGKAKQQLQSNLEELAKLTALSEGLLKLAQLKDFKLSDKQVQIDSIINEAITRIKPLAKSKNIVINSKVEDGLTVTGDKPSLIEALTIILDNAVKYSPAKTEITITAHKNQKNVDIVVEDNGIGIKATELTHIFDRFYRADAARSKQGADGYGVGLAIAKTITELHHGKITVVSKPGKGSTFTIHLAS